MAVVYSNFFGGAFFGGGFFGPGTETGSATARGGKSRRIHPRWIREYDLESELPEVIQKKHKLTKKVEAKLQKTDSVEITLDPFQTKAELQAAFQKEAAAIERSKAEHLARDLDEEDDWLILML